MSATKQKPSNEEILKVMHRDPLQVAESVIGESHPSWDSDEKLFALRLVGQHNRQKTELLKARNDTCFSTKTTEHREILLANGFELIYEEKFIDDTYVNSPKYPQPAHEQQFFIYYRHPGILLAFDTYHDNVNGGHLYYNWKAHSETIRIPDRVLESGFTTQAGIHVGSRDCREGLIMAIERMEEHGTFLETWVEGQFIWLLNYMESKSPGYDHAYISLKKLRALPDRVRKLILPAQEAYLRRGHKHNTDATNKLLEEPLPTPVVQKTVSKATKLRGINYRVAFKRAHSRGLRMGYLKPRDLELRKPVEQKRRIKLLMKFMDS
jgi:hypothetical protein